MLNNSNRTIRELIVLLEYIDLFCQMHYEEQRGASATYYVSITTNLLAKHGKRGIKLEHNLSIIGKLFEQRSIA